MPISQIKKSSLPDAEQRLIEAIQTVSFGWLHEVHVQCGRPTFTPAPKAVRDIKLGAGEGPRPELTKSDFLKREVVELMQTIRTLDEGVLSIECRHGLPARVRYEMEGVVA